MTRGSGGAKEPAQSGHLKLVTLQGKKTPSETPLLWIGLSSHTYVQGKERGQMEAKSFSSRTVSKTLAVIPKHEITFTPNMRLPILLDCLLKAILWNTVNS